MTVTEIQHMVGLRQNNEPELSFSEEEEDEALDSPKMGQISKNPILKIFSVMGFVGLGIGVLAMFLSLKPSLDTAARSQAAIPEAASEKEKTKEEFLAEENAQLKARLAMVQQNDILAAETKVSSTLKEPKPKLNPKTKLDPKPTEKPTGTITQVAYEQPSSPLRFVRERPQPKEQKTTPKASLVASKQVIPLMPVPEVIPENNYEDWLALSNLGYYSNLGESANSEEARSGEGEPTSQLLVEAPVEEEEEEVASTKVLLGQKVKGSLQTPIVWAINNPQTRTLIRLDEAIQSESEDVIPEGTLLIFTVRGVDGSGIVQGAITGFIKNNQIIQLPEDSFILFARDAMPLVAKNSNSRQQGSQIGRILTRAGLGALGKTGELLNRPSSISSFTSSQGNFQSITSGGTNYVGSVLEGAAEPIIDELEREAQRNIDSSTNSNSPLWQIKAGTKVELIVVAPF
jgi:hypothetical protein